LLAVSRAQSDPIQRFNGATIARAAGLKAKGDTIKLGTGGAAKIIRDTSADLKRGREQDKQYDVLIKHRPQSGFYDSQRKLNEYEPNHSTDGRPNEADMGNPTGKGRIDLGD
jgi:capsid protein